MAKRFSKVIVVGLDGLEPSVVEPMLQTGRLPNLERLRQAGMYSHVATTFPAQTPVAWSTFATGLNPGGHGVFDFIRRDPKTYSPRVSLNRYEQKNPFVPPKVVNLRHGQTVWEILSAKEVPSTILRCPCSFPPEDIRGRVLSGMGVPDLRGAFGVPTFYTSEDGVQDLENENVVHVQPDSTGQISTNLLGPLSPKTHSPIQLEVAIHVDRSAKTVMIRPVNHSAEVLVSEGRWSDWLKVSFRVGLFQSAKGMVRFHLVRIEPVLQLYASPINFDPAAPMFPISAPAEYARELEANLGTYYTAGMVEDHTGLNNGRIDEAAFLDQCAIARREREAMLLYELDRFDQGLLFCLFDTPDRVQHMFWRFHEGSRGANGSAAKSDWEPVIHDEYVVCDATIGKVLEYIDHETMLIVLSDHGFNGFQRGMHLNAWLHDQGLLALQKDRVALDGGKSLRDVDWSHTKAYAMGLSGIYLNLKGREEQGIVPIEDANTLKSSIKDVLTGVKDEGRDRVAVRNVLAREEIYHGPCTADAPDVVVNFASGYRASWDTALGGTPQQHFEDNIRRWSGDHIVDPVLVPGVIFMNQPFRTDGARLLDLAPTILDALAMPKDEAMEGESLLR